jgi:site-specific DNA recombinase
MNKLQRGMARLIDGYAEGLIEKGEFEPRIKPMKQRVTVLEDQLQQLADEAVQQRKLKLLIGHLEEFVARVQQNLASADWMMKRKIIRALVRRVEIDKQEVTVVFRVGPDPSVLIPKQKSSQHCWRRADSIIDGANNPWREWILSVTVRGSRAVPIVTGGSCGISLIPCNGLCPSAR